MSAACCRPKRPPMVAPRCNRRRLAAVDADANRRRRGAGAGAAATQPRGRGRRADARRSLMQRPGCGSCVAPHLRRYPSTATRPVPAPLSLDYVNYGTPDAGAACGASARRTGASRRPRPLLTSDAWLGDDLAMRRVGLAAVGLFYGLFGVVRLGVSLDIPLILGAAALLTVPRLADSALISAPAMGERPSGPRCSRPDG